MTKEERYVVNPLSLWFKNQKVNWKLYRPRYGSSATGWDLEVRRKNVDLLIEAKYVDGPFLGSFTGLVTAPLANRPQHFAKTLYRSSWHRVCWAIGSPGPMRNIYQILFDYFVRNPRFWRHYCTDVKMLYVFFLKDNKVMKIRFSELLKIAAAYNRKASEKKLAERRSIAEELMVKYEYS